MLNQGTSHHVEDSLGSSRSWEKFSVHVKVYMQYLSRSLFQLLEVPGKIPRALWDKASWQPFRNGVWAFFFFKKKHPSIWMMSDLIWFSRDETRLVLIPRELKKFLPNSLRSSWICVKPKTFCQREPYFASPFQLPKLPFHLKRFWENCLHCRVIPLGQTPPDFSHTRSFCLTSVITSVIASGVTVSAWAILLLTFFICKGQDRAIPYFWPAFPATRDNVVSPFSP